MYTKEHPYFKILYLKPYSYLLTTKKLTVSKREITSIFRKEPVYRVLSNRKMLKFWGFFEFNGSPRFATHIIIVDW